MKRLPPNSRIDHLAAFLTEKERIQALTYAVFRSPQFARDESGIRASANQLLSLGILFRTFSDICGNEEFASIADRFFEFGISMIDDEGVFSENGGFDSSYQAFNLLLLSYIYIYDIRIKDMDAASLLSVMARGWEYELRYITPAGEIVSTENTRTGNGQETWRGREKPVNAEEVALALLYWSFIKDNAGLADLSYAIFKNAGR